MTKHAFLITGFNNWGKTRIIQTMFKRVKLNGIHELNSGCKFIVQQHSNDDVGIEKFIAATEERIKEYPNSNLICAFCPTKEDKNNSITFIKKLVEYGFTVHIIYIVHKWDCHAQLNVGKIKDYYKDFKDDDVKHIEIINPDPDSKVKEFQSKILEIVSAN